jgi:hypothetical protein
MRVVLPTGRSYGEYVRINKLHHHTDSAFDGITTTESRPGWLISSRSCDKLVVVAVASFVVDDIAPGKRRTYQDEQRMLLRGVALLDMSSQHAARRIQRAWREAMSNPTFALCKKRLLSEFSELAL